MIFRMTNSVSTLPRIGDDSGWTAYLSGKGWNVSARTALQVATVIRCVDVKAKTIASLPLGLFREDDTGNREKMKADLRYRIFAKMPNAETTAYEFWHMYIFNLLLTIGAYAKLVRNRNGFLVGAWNIPTSCVQMERNKVNGERYINVYTKDGPIETLREGEFMYTPGLRFSSADDPEDPIRIASEVLGLTISLNKFAKDFFENGANLGGVVELQGTSLSDTAYARFKESWHNAYDGIINQHKIAFLEEGAKFNKIDPKLNEAQALESRKFAVVEICRMFGVPPHKVFDLDRATFSNIEEMNIEFVQEAIVPDGVKIEQTLYKDTLTTADQRNMYWKFNVNGLLRGNMAARSAYYHNMRQDGIMNPDEIRELEDMNNQPDGQGKIYASNGNMIPNTSIPQNIPKGAQKST